MRNLLRRRSDPVTPAAEALPTVIEAPLRRQQLTPQEFEALVPVAQEPQAQVGYRGRFEGLWTDRADARRVIERRTRAGQLTDADVELLEHWIEHGYVIVRGAVAPDVCEDVKADLRRAFENGDPRLHAIKPGEHFGTPLEPGTLQAKMRVNDIYVYYESARRALFAEGIARFLYIVMSGSPTLLQSLTFEQGSQQGVHRDTAYVVVDPPLALAASWIALEDVQPGSGELMYYGGSHRMDDYLFSGMYKCWHPDRDGPEQHDDYIHDLAASCEASGLELKRFMPRQGDVLIWSADLAHGGTPVTDERLSRRSLVGHYCPEWAVPRYFDQFVERSALRPYPGGAYASMHYDVTAAD